METLELSAKSAKERNIPSAVQHLSLLRQQLQVEVTDRENRTDLLGREKEKLEAAEGEVERVEAEAAQSKAVKESAEELYLNLMKRVQEGWNMRNGL